MKFTAFFSAAIAWDLQMPNFSETFDNLSDDVSDSFRYLTPNNTNLLTEVSDYTTKKGQSLLEDIQMATSAKTCTHVDVKPDFELSNYLGQWYELYRSADIPKFWYDGECTTAHYQMKTDDIVQVDNTCQQMNPDGTFQPRDEKTPGEATYKDLKNKDAHLKVRFSKFQPWGSYNILYTDYETFSVVYECDNYLFDTQRIEFLWVLTRSPLNHEDLRDQ